MTVKINADTSDGLKFVSDTSGAIDFQSNGSTKMSMDASGNLTCTSMSGLHAPQIFHARDEKSQGTNGGSASGDNDRVVNTVLTNTITGASLSSNQITLPAGTYDVIASAPAHDVARHKLFFYNNTDSVSDIRGLNADTSTSDSVSTRAVLKQRITISAQKVYRIIHYTQSARSDYGLGLANSNGVECYTDVHITKVA